MLSVKYHSAERGIFIVLPSVVIVIVMLSVDMLNIVMLIVVASLGQLV
jgi:hypothetical protein